MDVARAGAAPRRRAPVRGAIASKPAFLQVFRAGLERGVGEVGEDAVDAQREVGQIFGDRIAGRVERQVVVAAFVAERVFVNEDPALWASATSVVGACWVESA